MKLVVKRSKSSYFYDPRVHGVTQSMLAMWLECREKSRLGTVLGLSPKGLSEPLIYGDIGHGLLERFQQSVCMGWTTTKAEAEVQSTDWSRQAWESWTNNNPRATTEAKDAAWRARHMAQAVFDTAYLKRWWNTDSKVTWLAVEKEFRVTIEMEGGTLIPLRGKMDGGFQSADGTIHLQETKHKGQFSSRISEWLSLDLQLGYYLMAANEAGILGGPVTHVCYNLVRRPGLRQKKDESLADLILRVRKEAAKDPAHYCERYSMKLTDTEMRRHVSAIRAKVAAFWRWWVDGIHDHMDEMHNPGACEGKYGACPMIDSCANGDRTGLYQRSKPSPELE